MGESMKNNNRALDDDALEEVNGGLQVNASIKTIYQHGKTERAQATTADYVRKAGAKPTAVPLGGKGTGKSDLGGTGIC